jgi:Cd2+/Zn2+-exporting ATPase
LVHKRNYIAKKKLQRIQMSGHHSHDTGCGCSSPHGVEHESSKTKYDPKVDFIYTSACFLVFAITLVWKLLLEKKNGIDEYYLNNIFGFEEIPLIAVIFIVVYVCAGYNVIFSAVKNLFRGYVLDENFLMTIATFAAICLGEFPEATGVMIFYKIGEYLQSLSVYRVRNSIRMLLAIRPDFANLVSGDEIVKISPEVVTIGSEIIVMPGEKIPLDGVIVDGTTLVDTSALTGESVPRSLSIGGTALAGMLNQTGLIKIKVEKTFGESSIAKILTLVENATQKKAKTELFFTTFARYYTPVIVGLTLLVAVIPPLFIPGETYTGDEDKVGWIYRALVLLVISCPCALVVSIPLTYFSAIGKASKRGILIKGSTYLDTLLKVKSIVFDKTGTLTKGVFKLASVVPVSDVSEAELLEMTAAVESYSHHPIAVSLQNAVSDKPKHKFAIADYTELSGRGITATIDGKSIYAGNSRLMSEKNITFNEIDVIGTIIYVALDERFIGYLVISDELKDDTESTMVALRKQGIENLQMLTGDNTAIAQQYADKLGLDSFHGDLMPGDKLTIFEELKKTNSPLIFVGDGTNDAPVLTLADIGISMGDIGTDIAIETADVVIMNDSLSKISELMQISRKTRTIIIQNIAFALGVKVVFVILGIAGVASLWEAVFADVGVTILAVFNASRIAR